MKYIRAFTLARHNKEQADEVCVRQNKIGELKRDRKITYICHLESERYAEEIQPVVYIACTETIEAMKNLEEDFYQEVEIFYGGDFILETGPKPF